MMAHNSQTYASMGLHNHSTFIYLKDGSWFGSPEYNNKEDILRLTE